MKRHILRAEITRTFSSPAWAVTIVSIVIMCFMTQWEQGYSNNVNTYIVSLIGFTSFPMVLLIMASVPSAAGFCSDWNSRYARFIVARSGVRRYLWSKYVTSVITSFAVVFLALLLYVALLAMRLPLFTPSLPIEQTVYPPFESLALGWFPFTYFLVRLFIFSITVSFYVSAGIVVSAYLPNRFVALAAPLVFRQILSGVSYKLPAWINIPVLSGVYIDFGWGDFGNFMYYFTFFIVLLLCMGLLFNHQAKRRLNDEVS